MRLACALLCLGMALGCRERKVDIKAAPERELPRPAPPEPMPSGVVSSLVGHAGEEVTISGTLVAHPHPRLPSKQPGKSQIFVDVDGSHLEIAAHVTALPDCNGPMFLTGKVIVAVGMAKMGSTEGEYAEPQLDVNRWRCR